MSKKSTLEQIHRSWFSDLIKETYYYCQSSLCRCGVQALLKYLKVVTEKELNPGVIAVIHTSGERINFSISLLASLRIFLPFIASKIY